MLSDLDQLHLDLNQWNGSVEQGNDIQEAAGDVLCNNDGAVLVLRISFSHDVPALVCANDVGFVCGAELEFKFISPLAVDFLNQQIEPSSASMNALAVFYEYVTKFEL